MAAVTETPITDEQKDKFPDFISSFMPDTVPVITPNFFEDNDIEAMIETNINQADIIKTTERDINQKNSINDFISRDIILAKYPNYRRINLVWAGLDDLNNYKNSIEIDEDYFKDVLTLEELVRDALTKITGIPHDVNVDNQSISKDGSIQDIELETMGLSYMLERNEENISMFKLIYDDTDYKTYIYDAVKMNQSIVNQNEALLNKISDLSGYNIQNADEEKLMTEIETQFNDLINQEGSTVARPSVAGATAPTVPAPLATPAPAIAPAATATTPSNNNTNINTFTNVWGNEPGFGGSKKRKTYKRTLKRAKRSKSKRRSF